MADSNCDNLRRWFEEVWNQQRESAIDELMAEDVKAYGIGDEPVDREGFKQAWRGFLEVFPDTHVVAEDVFGDEDKTAIRIKITGTHLGHGLGVPPTGKVVEFTAQSMTRWENGVIVEGWNTIDMASVYRQIGAHEQPPVG